MLYRPAGPAHVQRKPLFVPAPAGLSSPCCSFNPEPDDSGSGCAGPAGLGGLSDS